MSISILNEDLHEVQKRGEVDCHGLKWVYQVLWNQELVLYSKLMHHFFLHHESRQFCHGSSHLVMFLLLFCAWWISLCILQQQFWQRCWTDWTDSPDTMRLWLYTNGGNIWKRPLLPLGHATMWSCPIWNYLLYSSHSWSGFTATRLNFSWKTNYTNKVDEESCQDAKDDYFMIHL